MNFQYRVTAWVAVRILAEKELSLPWDLPEGTTLEWLRCETEQPVDDLLSVSSLPIAPVPLENGLGNALSTWLKAESALSRS